MSHRTTSSTFHRRIGKEDKRDYEVDSLYIVAHGISEKLEIPDHILDELNKLKYAEAKQAIIKALGGKS